jgi:hypothetical protein
MDCENLEKNGKKWESGLDTSEKPAILFLQEPKKRVAIA